MKSNIYILFLFLVSCFLSLTATPVAFAGISCQPIYGGGQTCASIGGISVNKTVINPQTGKMIDYLGINDPKFSADSIVTFQIALANMTDSLISHVDVKDIFPQYTIFSIGPGTFNPTNKTLTFRVDNLAANETRVFTLVGKVVDVSQLPGTQGATCVVNQVIATGNQGAVSQDSAQFCIEKKVVSTPVTKGGFPAMSSVPVTVSPPTGPEPFALFSLIPTAIIGWFLRKKFEYNNRSENLTKNN